MKTVLDKLVDKGRSEGWKEGWIRGRIKGEIKAILAICLFRFSETSSRLPQWLTSLNDLQLLELTWDFALIAPSLPDVEDFVEKLLRIKRRLKPAVYVFSSLKNDRRLK